MKQFFVSYRGEFGAKIKAENAEEAVRIFNSGKPKNYALIGELHPDYIEVEDETGRIIETY